MNCRLLLFLITSFFTTICSYALNPYISIRSQSVDAARDLVGWTDKINLFDMENLYVAIIAYDPDPSQIRARISDRDNIFSDDWVLFLIDTFNDQQKSYDFFCNPLGVQAGLGDAAQNLRHATLFRTDHYVRNPVPVPVNHRWAGAQDSCLGNAKGAARLLVEGLLRVATVVEDPARYALSPVGHWGFGVRQHNQFSPRVFVEVARSDPRPSLWSFQRGTGCLRTAGG